MGGRKIASTPCVPQPSYTVADYVQEGLIAMWDGIENVGVGTHDSDSVVWKDLVGDKDMLLYRNSAFLSSCLSIDDVSYACSQDPITSIGTIEVCLSRTDGNNDVCLLSLDSAGGRQMRNFISWYGNKIGFSETDSRTYVAMSCPKNWDVTTFTFVPVSGAVYSNGILKQNVSETFYYTTAVNYGGVSLNPGGIDRQRICGNWYCIRVYDRVLSDDEIAFNTAIDYERFVK